MPFGKGAGILSCRPRESLQVQPESVPDPCPKSSCHCFASSSVGNVVPVASCLSLHFPNLSLFPHCDDRFLKSLIAQPQVWGELSVWLPKSFGPLCNLAYMSLLSLGCAHSLTVLWQTCTYMCAHVYLHNISSASGL